MLPVSLVSLGLVAAGLCSVRMRRCVTARPRQRLTSVTSGQCAVAGTRVETSVTLTILSLASHAGAMGPGASVLLALSLVSPGLTQDYRSKRWRYCQNICYYAMHCIEIS